eukprot:CAMPEP_0171046878 /NCGR_PEP_ID=MMETSP0736-20130129/49850_1 /TAXON_ID=186038 /ORGANISM="Fragilariopsis kerguelensis, Strain L26-C5" /LENGTH=138 /DNA_ID=CAMNT_0011498109 /DNA_START=53 /DNA_END=469 /DNA_ORIENTATION=-
MVSKGGRGGRSCSSSSSSSGSYNRHHQQYLYDDDGDDGDEEEEEKKEENEEQETLPLLRHHRQRSWNMTQAFRVEQVVRQPHLTRSRQRKRIREAQHLSQQALRIAMEAREAAQRLQDYRSKNDTSTTSTIPQIVFAR